MNRSNRQQEGVRTAIMQTSNDYYIGDADMTPTGQTRKETQGLKDVLANPKVTRRIGTWNIRPMYSIGKTAQVVIEIHRYNLDILGINECRWTGSGKIRTSTGDNMLYSGRQDEHHSSGVAIIVTKEAAKTLEEWTPISKRIITASFWSRHIKTTLIQVYAPTNDADEETNDSFYEQLQSVIHLTPLHDITIVAGDLNAKIGTKLNGEDGIIGEHGLQSERNGNGDRFSSLCANNNLTIVSTMFSHNKIQLHTWTSPNGHHYNQLDHVAINGQYKRPINDVRAHMGADVGSDHNLVVIKTRLKLCKVGKKPSTSKRYETCKLKVPEINQRCRMELKNRFSVLGNENSNELEESWEKFKDIYNQTASTVLGPRKKRNQDWISGDSWKEVEKRRSLKEKIDGTRSERVKERLGEEYRNTDKNVRKSMRRDKKKTMAR